MTTIKLLDEYTQWTDADHEHAKRICSRMGYRDSIAWITSDALPGYKCLPIRQGQPQGYIVKAAGLGLLFIVDTEEV